MSFTLSFFLSPDEGNQAEAGAADVLVIARKLTSQELLFDHRADRDQRNRQRKVIEMRFGFVDGEPKTLDSIGKEFGITRERVRQIETQALNKLRAITKRKKIDFEEML